MRRHRRIQWKLSRRCSADCCSIRRPGTASPIGVVADDFYRPDHRLVFTAIGELVGEGKPCDVVTVSQQLERTGKLEAAGGLAYLSSIARDTPTAANVRAYADIVRERSLLRQLIRAGTDIVSAVFNNDGETARVARGQGRAEGIRDRRRELSQA